MRISDFDISQRKRLFCLSSDEAELLKSARPVIDANIEQLVAEFYDSQTNIPEISLLIGDSDTLNRLRIAQRKYIMDLFYGIYDLEYVNNRLRIGLVHKRIGVEPKLYLSAIYSLKTLINSILKNSIAENKQCTETIAALEKLLMFDITLVFDTYIRSMLTEIEIEKQKSDQYALNLEDKIKDRTRQLELLSRTDPLTGLLNVRHLADILTSEMRRAQRRSEPVTLVYMDINDFKNINDIFGHQKGDEIIKNVAFCITKASRDEDHCFRHGGDEFCIVMNNCDSASAAEIFAERLNTEIQNKCKGVSVSIGIAHTGPIDFIDPDQLIKAADEAMYKNKQESKSLRQPPPVKKPIQPQPRLS